jgi:hypothetical protein
VQTGRASLDTSAAGVVPRTVTVRTVDETCAVAIREGTIARDADGNPLGEVTVARADPTGVPAAPPGTGVAIVLNCGPAGATFDPPVTLTYTLSGEEWEKIGGATPKVIWYNPASKAWQDVPATVDPATRTVTARVSHFSIYALAWTVPETTVAQQTNTSPGGTPPAGDEPPWLFIGIGAVLLVTVHHRRPRVSQEEELMPPFFGFPGMQSRSLRGAATGWIPRSRIPAKIVGLPKIQR